MPNKVDKEKWYSLTDIVNDKMLKIYTSYETVRRVIKQDKEQRNLLKAIITGQGRGKKYHIKGSNIINFLDQWQNGDYELK